MCDERRLFLEMAALYSQMSIDPSTKVGAVITQNQKPIAMGYNHIVEGINYHRNSLEDRGWKYPRVVHAEEDALFALKGRDLAYDPRRPLMMFVTHHPCEQCAKMIIQHNIQEVWTHEVAPEMLGRWPGMINAAGMLKEAGVRLNLLQKP